jgi:hypothetical protein
MAIQHLAKQFGTKEVFKLRECGRTNGSEGSIRVLSRVRFEALNPAECCKTCTKRLNEIRLKEQAKQ